MKNDELYNIFITQLYSFENPKETAQEFIKRITQEYTLVLFKKGSIPFQLIDDVISDIECELIEMFRKKTYGHLSLEDYRNHHVAHIGKSNS